MKNNLITHIRKDTDVQFEFKAVAKWCRGLGIDIGCGSKRLSPSVLSTDNYLSTGVDLLWDHLQKGPYPFEDQAFDFVFSSHVIEDFSPEDIPRVFAEWWRMVKIGGYLVLLVPDMEGGRYPKWDEKFIADDQDVKDGKRKVGEIKGNPSHRINMGLTVLHDLIKPYGVEIVQENQLSKNQMTLDFVIRKVRHEKEEKQK